MTVLFLAPLLLFLVGAALARVRRMSFAVATGGALFAGVFAVVTRGGFHLAVNLLPSLTLGWRVDGLATVFLVISALIWTLIAATGIHAGGTPRTALAFNLSLAGIYLVLTAADAVTLLVGWEVMTIFAFLLILPNDGPPKAAFRFLAFGEVSSLLLIVAFGSFYAVTGRLSFGGGAVGAPAFLIAASLGFIVKMDVVPFHTWIRAAYERLPGYLAAFMSVAITLAGVYGLERVLAMSDGLRWWNLLLVLLGALSAFWGALRATVAGKLREVPGYSTVEYSGMILCAAGLSAAAAGGTGESLSYLSAFAGAAVVMLALSHAVSKSLFFLSLGEAADRTGVVHIGELRSIWRRSGRLPAGGLVVAGLSFAAFPPLAGYVGEWMLLETTFQSFRFPSFAGRFVVSLSGVFLALAIGMIAFAMVRYLGYVALGNIGDRDEKGPAAAVRARVIPTVVQLLLIGLVLGAGIAVPAVLHFIGRGALLSGLLSVPAPFLLVSGRPLFGVISPTFFAIVMVVLLAVPVTVWALRRRRYREVEVWNGGRPIVAEERFTPEAFSQILAFVLRSLHRTQERREGSERSLATSDPFEGGYARLWSLTERVSERFGRLFMNGRVAWYVGYVLITFALILVFSG